MRAGNCHNLFGDEVNLSALNMAAPVKPRQAPGIVGHPGLIDDPWLAVSAINCAAPLRSQASKKLPLSRASQGR